MTARWPPLPSMLSLLLVLLVAAGSIIGLTSACEPDCNVPPTPPSPPPPAPCPPPPSPPPIVYYYSPPPPPYYPSPDKPPKHSPPTPAYPSPPSGGGTPSANLGCCVIIPQGTLYPVDPGYKPSGAAKDDMQGRLAAGAGVLMLTLALWGWW